jgi:hypothetical protein
MTQFKVAKVMTAKQAAVLQLESHTHVYQHTARGVLRRLVVSSN